MTADFPLRISDEMILTGDCRAILPELSKRKVKVQTCITSPPYYGLRDYGLPGQIGLENTVQEYVDCLVGVFRQVRDLLASDGTLWMNLGDTYTGNNIGGRPKNLLGIPWRVALALQDDGWYLRQDIIWHKSNPVPESVTDRCVRAHEYLFLFSKNQRYYFDHKAIQEPSLTFAMPSADAKADFRRDNVKRGAVVPGRTAQHRKERLPVTARDMRNKRSVWTIATEPTKHSHVAAFPRSLVTPCVLAGSRPGDIVLDPFGGSGTVAAVANSLGRRWISIELDPRFAELQAERTVQRALAV